MTFVIACCRMLDTAGAFILYLIEFNLQSNVGR